MALSAQMQRASACGRTSSRAVASCSAPVRCTRPVFGSFSGRPAVQKLSVVCQAAAVEAAPATKAPKGKGLHPSTLNQGAPETYAIVEIAGHQMFVEPGKWYTCNRLQAEPGSKIRFGRVLAVKSGGNFTVGAPYLEDTAVEAEILSELRGPKVIVYKMKPKKHYRRKNGHRQELTKFMVTKIGA